jgi:hypothetical protein
MGSGLANDSPSPHSHDPAADAAALAPAMYDELRRIAARLVRGERPGQTLQATALVH